MQVETRVGLWGALLALLVSACGSHQRSNCGPVSNVRILNRGFAVGQVEVRRIGSAAARCLKEAEVLLPAPSVELLRGAAVALSYRPNERVKALPDRLSSYQLQLLSELAEDTIVVVFEEKNPGVYYGDRLTMAGLLGLPIAMEREAEVPDGRREVGEAGEDLRETAGGLMEDGGELVVDDPEFPQEGFLGRADVSVEKRRSKRGNCPGPGEMLPDPHPMSPRRIEKMLRGPRVRVRAKTSLSGEEFSVPTERGVVVVNLWATHCGPCIAEIKTLIRLRAELRRVCDGDVRFVSEDYESGVVRRYIRECRLPIDSWMAIERTSRAMLRARRLKLGSAGLPPLPLTGVFLKGRLVRVHTRKLGGADLREIVSLCNTVSRR